MNKIKLFDFDSSKYLFVRQDYYRAKYNSQYQGSSCKKVKVLTGFYEDTYSVVHTLFYFHI